MTERRFRPVLLVFLLLPAGCQAPAQAPRQAPAAPSRHVPAAARVDAADPLDPSGRPYDGPPGPVSSFPPADNNLDRLHCHPEGIGTRCDRDPD